VTALVAILQCRMPWAHCVLAVCPVQRSVIEACLCLLTLSAHDVITNYVLTCYQQTLAHNRLARQCVCTPLLLSWAFSRPGVSTPFTAHSHDCHSRCHTQCVQLPVGGTFDRLEGSDSVGINSVDPFLVWSYCRYVSDGHHTSPAFDNALSGKVLLLNIRIILDGRIPARQCLMLPGHDIGSLTANLNRDYHC